MIRPARYVAFAAAAVLHAACVFGPTIVGYRSITIDPATLRVEWQDPITGEFDAKGLGKPVLGSYYQIFTGQSGGTSVEHYFQSDPEVPRIRYSYLDTGDHVLCKSVNDREILRGPFGTVLSIKTCYYHLPENYFNEIVVHLYATASEYEPPTISDEPPRDAVATLTSVSVVRVLRGDPQYVVVAAVYAADGRVKSVSVEGGRNGDWVQGSVPGGTGTLFFYEAPTPDELPRFTRFGLPNAISIESALTQRPVGLASPSDMSVDRDAITLHYAYDRWMRQDEYPAAGGHQTRYLTYVRTPEDIALDGPCGERFRERDGPRGVR